MEMPSHTMSRRPHMGKKDQKKYEKELSITATPPKRTIHHRI